MRKYLPEAEEEEKDQKNNQKEDLDVNGENEDESFFSCRSDLEEEGEDDFKSCNSKMEEEEDSAGGHPEDLAEGIFQPPRDCRPSKEGRPPKEPQKDLQTDDVALEEIGAFHSELDEKVQEGPPEDPMEDSVDAIDRSRPPKPSNDDIGRSHLPKDCIKTRSKNQKKKKTSGKKHWNKQKSMNQ